MIDFRQLIELSELIAPGPGSDTAPARMARAYSANVTG